MDFLIFLLILKMSEIPCQAGPVFFYKKKVAYLFFLGPLFKSKIQPDESPKSWRKTKRCQECLVEKSVRNFQRKSPSKCLEEMPGRIPLRICL